jgi:hypothetical protein
MESNEIPGNKQEDRRNEEPGIRENKDQAPEKSAKGSRDSDEASVKLTEKRQGAFNEDPDLKTDKILDEGEE